jgi:hypothetical protein
MGKGQAGLTSANDPGNGDEKDQDEDAAATEQVSDEYRVNVAREVGNAQLLVEYVCSQGKEYDAGRVAAVIAAGRLCETDGWTLEKESEFWEAYNALAESVKPVTVSSLKDNVAKYGRISARSRILRRLGMLKDPQRVSEAGKIVFWYRLATGITITLLLFLQVYWVVGDGMVTKINETPAYDTAAVSHAMSAAGEASLEVDRKRRGITVELQRWKERLDEANFVADGEANPTVTLKKRDKTDTNPITLKAAEWDLGAGKVQIHVTEAMFQRIERWNADSVTAIELYEKSGKTLNESLLNESITTETMAIVHRWNRWWMAPLLTIDNLLTIGTADEEPESDGDGDASPTSTTADYSATVGASYALNAISDYLLPLLYGLLGALAYVLRTLTKEIKSLTYSRAQNIGYGLRLQLGALAGLAIGWFVKGGDGDTPAEAAQALSAVSLSAWALAFIAGYSVEVLFALMDKFIKAFSAEPA